MCFQFVGSRRTTEEDDIHDETVFMGGTENRSGNRQQKKFEYRPKMTADHGEKCFWIHVMCCCEWMKNCIVLHIQVMFTVCH